MAEVGTEIARIRLNPRQIGRSKSICHALRSGALLDQLSVRMRSCAACACARRARATTTSHGVPRHRPPWPKAALLRVEEADGVDRHLGVCGRRAPGRVARGRRLRQAEGLAAQGPPGPPVLHADLHLGRGDFWGAGDPACETICGPATARPHRGPNTRGQERPRSDPPRAFLTSRLDPCNLWRQH